MNVRNEDTKLYRNRDHVKLTGNKSYTLLHVTLSDNVLTLLYLPALTIIESWNPNSCMTWTKAFSCKYFGIYACSYLL